MPMLFSPAILGSYSDIAGKALSEEIFIFIGIFYPSGESILMHLLRYRAFAVDNHSCMPCALHLHQPQLVNNPGQGGNIQI
jgi:hypothetical protein